MELQSEGEHVSLLLCSGAPPSRFEVGESSSHQRKSKGIEHSIRARSSSTSRDRSTRLGCREPPRGPNRTPIVASASTGPVPCPFVPTGNESRYF